MGGFNRLVSSVFVMAISAMSFSAQAEDAAKDLGSVMLLGDSITQAAVGTQGFRFPLWKHLVEGGYEFDFVGSQLHNFNKDDTNDIKAVSDYPEYKGHAFDADNEGHWGWKTTDILGQTAPTRTPGTGTGKLADWLAAYTPDTVILLLGVNDIRIKNGLSVESTKANMQTIVEAIIADNPNVSIYLVSVLPTDAEFAEPEKIEELNTAYLDIVKQDPSIHFVDVRSAFDPKQHTYDGVHPNPEGEKVLADEIYGALRR